MANQTRIHWDFILVNLLLSTLIFLLVMVAPVYSLGRAPILLTGACLAVLLLVRGQPGLVELAVLAVVITLAATTVPSIEPHRSWVEAVGISGGLLGMLASRVITRQWLHSNRFLIGIFAIGMYFQISLSLSVVDWFNQWHEIMPALGGPPISFRLESGNAKAGILVPLFFIELALFFSIRKTWARVLTLLGIAWTLVLIYFSSSRGALIGLGAGSLCFIIAERRLVFEWIRPVWDVLARRRWLLVVTGVALLAGILAVGWLLLEALGAHPTHGPLGLGSRIQFWKPAWEAFLRSPIWGNGINTFVHFYLETISIPLDSLYTYAHNMYLDILLGGGIIGLAVAGLLIAAVWAGFRRVRLQAEDPHGAPTQNRMSAELPAVPMAALPILVAFLAHSVFDDYIWHPQVAVFVCVIFGAALAKDAQHLKIKLPAAQIASVLVLAAAWGLYYVQQPYLQAQQKREDEDWRTVATLLDESVARLPLSPLFNREAGFAYAQIAAEADTAALQTATDHFEAAAAHDPNYAMHWLNLGALYREAGNLEGARAAMETATQKAWDWGLAWLNLGEVCELSSDDGCARQAYLKALALKPDWVGDPYWGESPLRRDAATAARAIQTGTRNPGLLEMDAVLHQGYARPLIELAAVKLAAGELDDAEKLIKLAPMYFVSSEYEYVDIHWLEAELAAARGNFTTAVELGLAAREEFEVNRLNDTMATGTSVYGSWIYLLPTLGIDLTPQVTWMQYPGDWQARMEKLAQWQK